MSPQRIDASYLQRISVLFEDDDILAIAKPSGLSVHGGAGEEAATIIDLVRRAYSPPIDVQLAHRLDRGTSGVLLLAKNKGSLRQLIDDWDRSSKIYLAIVLGLYRGPSQIKTPLRDDDGVMRPAVTHVRVRAEMPELEPQATLLEIRIESGRTHQIRRHLVEAGYPILLDDKHGDFKANKGLIRTLKARGGKVLKKGDLLLHAWKLTVKHPVSGAEITLIAPIPEVWSGIVDRLVDALAETS